MHISVQEVFLSETKKLYCTALAFTTFCDYMQPWTLGSQRNKHILRNLVEMVLTSQPL